MHVPGWHEATKELQEQGKLQMVGIIQEQHPDRARLFMQWKQMGWPVLVDSLNLSEVPYVPITLGVDEHGILRHSWMPDGSVPKDLQGTFLSETSVGFSVSPAATSSEPEVQTGKALTGERSAEEWRSQGNSIFLFGGKHRIGEAIEAYENALRLEPQHGSTRFRLGVAYRKRYDSEFRQLGDFAKAVECWSAALETDPNNYVWRRRIQQYGPRLDKPYSFYDWVTEARGAITARGEKPVRLAVEVGGAEAAQPSEMFRGTGAEPKEPDPEGRILRDENEFIRVETIVVPDTTARSFSARVYVVFRPLLEKKAHWNNEVNDLVLWIDPPKGWEVDNRLLTVANPPEAVSQETREVEFEIRGPKNLRAGPVAITGYALYHVCEDVSGVCMYRRQDVVLKTDGSVGAD